MRQRPRFPRPRFRIWQGSGRSRGGAAQVGRYDRYVLGQMLALFGLFAFVLVAIYWINRAVILFDQLIADGQGAGTFLTFTALALPNVMRLVLPVAAFAAAVQVTDRLSRDSELVVARAAGLSPWRLARPVLAFGLVLVLFQGALVHVLVPQSRTRLAEEQARVEANFAGRLLTEGRFVHPAGGVTVFIRDITPEGELRDILLSDARAPDQRTVYTAARAWLLATPEGPQLFMREGTAQRLRLTDQRLEVTRFDSLAHDMGALLGSPRRGRRDVREYPTAVLFAPDAAALEATRKPAEVFLYEGHLRIVQPFGPAVAALIGFAALQLGSFSRFGVWRQVALAVGLLIAMQSLETAAADFARRDMALWPLIYLPSLAGLAAVALMLGLAAWPGLWRRRRPA